MPGLFNIKSVESIPHAHTAGEISEGGEVENLIIFRPSFAFLLTVLTVLTPEPLAPETSTTVALISSSARLRRKADLEKQAATP